MYGLIQVFGEVVLRLVEDRQRRDADRLLAGDERLGVADRLRLVDQRLLVVEVDPLHRGRELVGAWRSGRTAASVPPPSTPAVLLFASGIVVTP